jgi:hypothetical protein
METSEESCLLGVLRFSTLLAPDDSPEGSAEPFVRKIEDKGVHYMSATHLPVAKDTPTGGKLSSFAAVSFDPPAKGAAHSAR